MLYIEVSTRTPRIEYACAQLAALWGNVSYRLTTPDNPPPIPPHITYGTPPKASGLAIPFEGLLAETHVRAEYAPWQIKEVPLLFPIAEEERQAGEWDFDLLAALFYLLTDYEKYVEAKYDVHGRYNPMAYPSAQWGLETRPLAHLWAERAWESLKQHFPNITRPPSAYHFELTADLDFPWKYLYKAPGIAAGGLLKAMLRGHWQEVEERIRTHLSGKDPYDTFEEMATLMPTEETTLFCLIERHAPEDSRFTWRHPAWRARIQALHAQGYRMGIHPSYTTFLDGAKIKKETDALSEILDVPITHSRQHYLRYRMPETFRHLIAAGISDDYSLCRYDRGGFPCGMAQPFMWFDLERNTATSLQLHPTHIMDRSLQLYLQLTPQAASSYVERILSPTQKVGGTFTLLIHNDSLSESGEWKGWRTSIRQVVTNVRKS